MEFLQNILILLSMSFVVVLHCWCISTLFSHRFGVLKGAAWFLLVVLLPLLGPLIFVVATSRFRAQNRPARRREFAWFAGVFFLSMTVVAWITINQYITFNRRVADVATMSALKDAKTLLTAHIEKTGRAPDQLAETGFVTPRAAIHITYVRTGADAYVLTGRHEKGACEMRMTGASADVEKSPRKER